MFLLSLEERALPSSFAFADGKLFQIENNSIVNVSQPFPGYTGDVSIDNNGDYLVLGVLDGPPHVKVFETSSLAEKSSFYAYSPEFLGGINVSVGKDKIATGPDFGPPHYKEFDLSGTELTSLYVGNPNSFSGLKPSLAKDVPEVSFQSKPSATNVLEIAFTPDFPKFLQPTVLNYVSNYLSDFNINVTNTSLAYSGFNSYRSLVGGVADDYNLKTQIPDFVKGVSDSLGRFRATDFSVNTSYVFAKELDYNPIKVANAIVHEFIHQATGQIAHSDDQLSVFRESILPFIGHIDERSYRLLLTRL